MFFFVYLRGGKKVCIADDADLDDLTQIVALLLPALGVPEAIHKLNGDSETGFKKSEKNPANIVNSENSDSDKKNKNKNKINY